MFKVPARKQKRKRIIRSGSSDDEENVKSAKASRTTGNESPKGQNVIRKKKKKRKYLSKSALSFSLDAGDDVDSPRRLKTKEKRSAGLGFGGGPGLYDFDDTSAADPDQEGESGIPVSAEVATFAATSSLYSKENLAKLKSEQKLRIRKNEPPSGPHYDKIVQQQPTSTSAQGGGVIPLPPPSSRSFISKPSVPEEDFISLDAVSKNIPSTDHPEIICGDDALKYTVEDCADIEMTSESQPTSPQICQELNDDLEGKKWEDEVARRAGVGSTRQEPQTTWCHNIPIQSDPESGSQIINQIKQTIQNALENIQQQNEDIESNILRKKHDALVSQEDSTEKQNEVERVGASFEYYQRLRSDLADWVGAMRFLDEKVSIIERAIRDLHNDLGSKDLKKRQELEDDAIAFSVERGWLDYVVGRQPGFCKGNTLGHRNVNHTVDEFGRDVRSMESLARSKRRSERQRRRKESRDRRTSDIEIGHQKNLIGFEDTDADISDVEIIDRGERREAFSDALQFTFDGSIHSEFTSFTSLLSFFQKWYDARPNDYRNCYVNLAAIDFMAVLARGEFCKDLDLLCLSGTRGGGIYTLDGFEWFKALKSSKLIMPTEHERKETNQPFELLMKKVCFAALNTCIGDGDEKPHTFKGYDPFSQRQSMRLSSFCRSVVENLPSAEVKATISTSILMYINYFLQDLSFPVIKQDHAVSKLEDAETAEMHTFVTTSQLHRLKRLVLNILNFWYPVLNNPKALAKFCFIDIIAYRFLPIANALQTSPESKEVFVLLWASLKNAGLTENEDMMQMSSSFRAAALMYGIQ